MDEEGCTLRLLGEERHRIERESCAARFTSKAFGERFFQLVTQGLVANLSGKRHVKTKILEHIRVAPSVEIADLPLAQCGGEPAPALSGRERCAEPVEACHHRGRKGLKL